jgi:hypothetical protein
VKQANTSIQETEVENDQKTEVEMTVGRCGSTLETKWGKGAKTEGERRGGERRGVMKRGVRRATIEEEGTPLQ